MLQPREADLPALILAFVVLPLVAYLFLGIWSEAVKKKARINLLAQLAVEEACRVEAMVSADVVPIAASLKPGVYECAKCCAPATTRCSRCKSVRYCSGKCQIIHWRQGHKQECQLWKGNYSNVSACSNSLEEVPVDPLLNSSKSSHGKDFKDLLPSDHHDELPDDSALASNDISLDSEFERKQSNKHIIDELKRVKPKLDDIAGRACHGVDGHYSDTQILSSAFSREISPEDGLLGNKLGTGNSLEGRRNQDTSCSSSAKNAIKQTINLAGEKLSDVKQGGLAASSYGIDNHAVAEREHDASATSANIELYEAPSTNVTIDVGHSDHDDSLKGSITYKKPPYTLGNSSLSHKLDNGSREHPSKGIERNAYKENGSSRRMPSLNPGYSGVPQKNTSANSGLHISVNPSIEGKMVESKRSPKNLKQNLVTLINNNKNKMPRMLFPYENLVEFFQCEPCGISPRGLVNCGNSCYANAVLQCLSYTKPLMVYLLQRMHSRTCFGKEWCLMCELEQHVSMLRGGGGPFSPTKILSNMKSIGCRMGGGNQEDAHEFLRLLIMSMQAACLEGFGGEKEVDARLQETTLIQQIFGGRLRSIVKCLGCRQESVRYENMMDLTLEIHGWVESLEDALTQFTAPEDLDGDNMYRCARCSTYVKARKQLSLHEVPNILTIVLKRFQTGKYGKINKCVTFPDMLDMIPFMTGTVDNPPLYLLYAVIVHLDNFNASFSGHYISYVKDQQGSWFRIDDSEVQAVPLSQVMSEGAYMLFYSRSFPRPPSGYTDKVPLQVSSCATSTSKNQKLMKHGQLSQPGTFSNSEKLLHPRTNSRAEYRDYSEDQVTRYIPRSSSGNVIPRKGTYSGSMSADFSDATSSDWTLFTSSDDSSFTTESTRDSFSMVECGDNGSISALASIFSPLYMPEYSQKKSTISCTKFSPSKLETRFFSESTGYAIDPSMLNRPIGGCT